MSAASLLASWFNITTKKEINLASEICSILVNRQYQIGYTLNMVSHIREFRKMRGLSQAKLAERTGTTPAQVHRLEHGQRKLTVEWATRLADALGIPVGELLSSERVPVIGIIEDERVSLFECYAAGPAMETDPVDVVSSSLPPSWWDKNRVFSQSLVRPTSGVDAALVVGDGMWPMFERYDVVFIGGWNRLTRLQSMRNHLCVIRTADGETHFRRLRPGSGPGLFNLASFRQPEIPDADVRWACSARATLFGTEFEK